MKITPSLSCKIYSGLNVKDAAKPLFFNAILQLFAFTAFVFSVLLCCLLTSCSANDDGSGSLTIAMPDASSSSRSIASSGSFQREDLAYMTFSVYLRDEDNNEVEKYTGLAQGSTLTIDQLRAGTYNIAIRGIGDGEVGFYGATEALVKGGTENTARIVMEAVESDNKILFRRSVEEYMILDNRVDARITAKNGDAYFFSDESPASMDFLPDGAYCYEYPLSSDFFEPGFTYTMEVTIYRSGVGTVFYTGTVSAKASKSGITFIVG